MKSSLVAFAGVILALAPLVGGCGAVDAEEADAKYPQPVGYDAPEQAVASSAAPAAGAQAETQAPQPASSEALAAQAEDGTIAPQEGDIAIGADADTYSDTDPSALSDFKPALDPYGTWVDDGTYGTVWVPSSTVVGADFSPYVTAGHWTYGDDYVWVSDYEWGWAPFHYGRWVYIGGRGWSWIPGRQYAGAWVSWRYGYGDWGYVGWAPMPPTWYWRGGVAVGVAYVPPAPYVFCGHHDLFAPAVGSRLVPGAQVPAVAAHTNPYVPASPTVAGTGHVGAQPTVGRGLGPSPSLLHLSANEVARAPVADRGVLHAQQFSRPATAQALGARAPVQTFHANTATASAMNRNAFASPGVPRQNGPVYSGRNAAVATAPQYRGVAPTPFHATPSQVAPSYSRPAPSYGTQQRAFSSPSYSTQPRTFSSSPTFTQPHTFSAPHTSSPSFSTPHTSSPSFSAPHTFQAPHYSAPVSRPSFGGFHGGGGARGGRR